MKQDSPAISTDRIFSHPAFRLTAVEMLLLVVMCLGLMVQFASAQPSKAAVQANKGWAHYGGGPDSAHFVALNQINKSNVSQLKVVWNYPTEDNNSYLFNPIVVDNVMYLLAKKSSLVALDATTGKELWIHANLSGIAARGISYWESKDRKDRRLIFTRNFFLEEIDAQTGKSIVTFGKDGIVDLRERLGRDSQTITRIQSQTPGRVFENLIILGSATGEGYLSPPGDIRTLDVVTGELVWTFHTIPHPGEYGYETWPKDAWKYIGGVNCWGEMTVDEKRGIVYIPVASPTYDYYGADRAGSNLFSTSLVALDARTGKRLWHYQLVHHDLWDYDPTAAPQLVTVRHNGKPIDAVAQAGKTGFLYVFDRVTGKPLWPIEERPVPKSEVPGEQSWPTQPIPTVLPPFARQKLTLQDINPYVLTPDERAQAKEIIVNAVNGGLFTPLALDKDTVALPGARGGANWGTTAADPAKGLVFVVSQDWPSIYHLGLQDPYAPRNNSNEGGPSSQQGRTTYQQNCQVCHGADRTGSGVAPSLAGVTSRLDTEEFRLLARSGRGKMPAFPNLDNATVEALFGFLANPEGAPPNQGGRGGAQGAEQPVQGPVVETGGASGERTAPPAGTSPYTFMSGPPYPEGVEGPPNRYYTGYGFSAHVISPPWSELVAYDLNTGTIKWRVPVGEDREAVAQGAKNTGTFGSRSGPLVTASGLIFVAARDGKIRAYDENTGKVLWTASLPAASEGIPAMYAVNGRQYLVVPASSAYSSARRPLAGGAPATEESATGTRPGYVTFALPGLGSVVSHH